MSQQIHKGCSHDDRNFLVRYKSVRDAQGILETEIPRILCLDCLANPDFVNDGIVDLIFNIETGERVN